MTPAGQRANWRITFLRSTMAPDAYNQLVETWAPHGPSLKAKIIFGTGAERREAVQTVASSSATFIVWATPLTRDIAETDRIDFKGRSWDISSIVPRGRAEIEITAVARARETA